MSTDKLPSPTLGHLLFDEWLRTTYGTGPGNMLRSRYGRMQALLPDFNAALPKGLRTKGANLFYPWLPLTHGTGDERVNARKTMSVPSSDRALALANVSGGAVPADSWSKPAPVEKL